MRVVRNRFGQNRRFLKKLARGTRGGSGRESAIPRYFPRRKIRRSGGPRPVSRNGPRERRMVLRGVGGSVCESFEIDLGKIHRFLKKLARVARGAKKFFPGSKNFDFFENNFFLGNRLGRLQGGRGGPETVPGAPQRSHFLFVRDTVHHPCPLPPPQNR